MTLYCFPVLLSNSEKCHNTYGLLTKCEVKMAGYWPTSFFACIKPS